jgi:L-ribulose-5-phosphate 3-epimerase
MVAIGIMQGRLLPPIDGRIQTFPADGWPAEFPQARDLGFELIEFIFDGDAEPHPFMSARGRSRVRAAIDASGVRVESVCADYFMTTSLHAADRATREQAFDVLQRLIRNSAELGVRTIILPCVDASSLRGARDQAALTDALTRCLPALTSARIRLALETDLGPEPFHRLLQGLPADAVGVNYDMGNSASLGFSPADEFAAYGDRVIAVHVKDRLKGGGTVRLGTGDTDFDACFAALSRVNYPGPFIIQGARGIDDAGTAAEYLGFVRARLAQAA